MPLTVLVPCFHDEGNVDALLARLTSACERSAADFEILLIDDGSRDGTWQAISAASERDARVRGIRLSRNHGHQIAVSAGLRHARGRRVLIIDSDLEDPPELLPEMMRLMDEGIDNVYGVRLSREGVPLWKRACYRAFYRTLTFFAGCDIPEDSGDFRLLSRRVVDHLNAMPEQTRFLRGMVSWLGFPSAPFPYHRERRHAGHSGYTLRKLFLFAVDGITSFSITPLRLATMLGLLMSGLWILGIVYVAVSVLLLGAPVSGWASLIIAVLLVGSVQLLVMGVFGEYLGRMFLEAKRRPLYVIRDVAGGVGRDAADGPDLS